MKKVIIIGATGSLAKIMRSLKKLNLKQDRRSQERVLPLLFQRWSTILNCTKGRIWELADSNKFS